MEDIRDTIINKFSKKIKWFIIIGLFCALFNVIVCTGLYFYMPNGEFRLFLTSLVFKDPEMFVYIFPLSFFVVLLTFVLDGFLILVLGYFLLFCILSVPLAISGFVLIFDKIALYIVRKVWKREKVVILNTNTYAKNKCNVLLVTFITVIGFILLTNIVIYHLIDLYIPSIKPYMPIMSFNMFITIIVQTVLCIYTFRLKNNFDKASKQKIVNYFGME